MPDKTFEIVNQSSRSPFIITCEHASPAVPSAYGSLGLSSLAFDTHIARDKGAGCVARLLAQKLGCCAILGKYSRLLIDLNRRENEDELIVSESDGVVIPANQNIMSDERERRLNCYYRPYHEAVLRQISVLQQKGKQPVIFSVHSYTPQLKGGMYRPWNAGILWHKKTNLSAFLLQNLSDMSHKIVGENVPYDLRLYNTGTVVLCGEEKGLDYGLIEIRDDEFDQFEKGVSFWAETLADVLDKYKRNTQV